MKNIIKTLLILIITLIAYFYYSYNNFTNKTIVFDEKTIEIKKWETLNNLASQLDINKYFLKKYLENNDSDFKLLAWNFKIEKNSNIKNIIKNLKVPLNLKEINITFLEWWNIYDIDNYLTNKWYINSQDYINYVENSEKIKILSGSDFFPNIINEDFISLEGYLYPDTYSLNYPLQINKLIIKQLNNFENKVYNNIKNHPNLKKIDNIKKLQKDTIYDIVKLASIVEKEERVLSEKSTVAWILKKRLQNGWNIWADITVCYPHKLTSEECKMVITKYIWEKSEYNTRTMTWLPKTPIWNPSYETINATLNDNKTEYWYYLHNIKSWKIYYWKTDSEHNLNKRYMY